MKKITLLLFCLMFVSALCAQRLNHQGKKMVRSVTVTRPNDDAVTKYNFYYDSENRLIKVDYLHKGNVFYTNVGWVKDKDYVLRTRMEYKNGRLQRTDYDEYGKRKSYNFYSYVLDANRYVVERATKDLSGPKNWYLKEVSKFTYGHPYKEDIRQIIKETVSSFVVDIVRGKEIEKEVVGDRYTIWYDVIDGNTYYGRGGDVKYACEYNDLNINVYYLCLDIERLTEWYNFYSECLPEKDAYGFYRYYFTDDEPYNLYKIEGLSWGKKVERTYFIDYVY